MSDTEAGGRRETRGSKDRTAGLDTPRTRTGPRLRLRPDVDPESFGRGAERFARFMGTARFLVYMTAFVTVWLLWNTLAPTDAQFDPEALNYTLLTLILSLQASYAAPLILLAQNRQADRDRVQNAQDRVAGERALADTEFLTREVADLKIALREVATRDFLRSEMRTLLEELLERQDDAAATDTEPGDRQPREPKRGKGKSKREKQRPDPAAPPADAPAHPPVGLDQPLERALPHLPEALPEALSEALPEDLAPFAPGDLPEELEARLAGGLDEEPADQQPPGHARTVTDSHDRPHPQGLQRRT